MTVAARTAPVGSVTWVMPSFFPMSPLNMACATRV
jgi:hypothetical protein